MRAALNFAWRDLGRSKLFSGTQCSPEGSMFKTILREVVENTDGALASILMGFDGITVDSYSGSTSKVDMETVGSEYSQVLTQIKAAAQMLEMGTANEVAVQADNMVTLMRMLNDEYFVALALEPSGNVGKGRFLLRLQAGKLLETLAQP
jgi:predicted regulator of Ras-like GTPase activity (Roadblock/LC7/MglB family)